MPTYVSTTRNQFRVPAGAVNDPPDVPGFMLTALQDVDDRLSIGGGEYCADSAAVLAIPSSRTFLGKLAYRADTATVYRYVGAGNTALGANAPTAKWQGWHRNAKSWVPVIASGYSGTLTLTGNSQIVAGRLFLDLFAQAGSGFALTNAELQVSLGGNEQAVGQYVIGSGYYQPAGTSGSGQSVPLAFYTAGAAAGVAATAARIRVPRIQGSTVPDYPRLVYPFAAIGAGSTTDNFAVSLSAPSALVL